MKSTVGLNSGTILQIIGPVMDISFPSGKMPSIYNSLVIEGKTESGEDLKIICEVQQLLGDNVVRAISMSATDGLQRGVKVIDTGSALSVPVGSTTLGRIFNVLGEPVDQMGDVDYSKTLPIHRSAPSFIDLDTQLSIFETGIKVVDLLAPYRRGGKIGLFGGAGGLTFISFNFKSLANKINLVGCKNLSILASLFCHYFKIYLAGKVKFNFISNLFSFIRDNISFDFQKCGLIFCIMNFSFTLKF